MLLEYILAFFVTVAIAGEEKPDYCDPKWCPNQGEHIACNNDGSFGPKCDGKHWIENLDEYQEIILDLHNEKRNELALGNVEGFEFAARMPSLRWDTNLSKMAELNVKTCYFEHDGCRSTTDFPYCGQNIYFAQTTFTNYTILDFIKEAVDMWFLEHFDCDMEVMKSFKVTEPQTGHFTAMMVDRTDCTGCAFLHSILQRLHKKPLHTIIFTCNYPSTNIVNVPTYKTGTPASMCKKKHHSKYKGLCHEKEVIDPNDFWWYYLD